MTEQFTFGGEIVWKPTPEHIQHANLTAFMRTHGIKDFDELMHKSTTDVACLQMRFSNFLIFNSMNRTQKSLISPAVFNSRNGAWMGR